MGKPRLIILVRHAQSEGNKNRDIHQTTPDHRVKLTPDGWSQAHEAGRRLRNLLRPDDTLQIFTSPYRRTRETTEGILSTLTSDDPSPSPFQRQNIKVYEEPRLREQDFGNFQPCSAEMERMWQERADYGHFFYRIPNGESAADAYDRVSGFNESLWRQFGEDDFASVCVLVTHGLMSRVFLMKWYHFTVEYFEDLRNVNHCEFLIMRKEDNGKYTLENNLRTWSNLRRERALKEAKDGTNGTNSPKKLDRSGTFVPTRRWGGCPNGCNHSRHYKKREDLELLRQKDIETTIVSTTATIAARRQRQQLRDESSDEDDQQSNSTKATPPSIDLTRSKTTTVDESASSPEAILRYPHHLHIGRDFGGTYSGHASTAGSDTDASEDEHHRHRRLASLDARMRTASGLRSDMPAEDGDDEREGHHHHAFANRLGDAPPAGSDDGDDQTSAEGADDGSQNADTGPQEDLDEAEKEDRSIRGSVY